MNQELNPKIIIDIIVNDLIDNFETIHGFPISILSTEHDISDINNLLKIIQSNMMKYCIDKYKDEYIMSNILWEKFYETLKCRIMN